MFLIGRVDVRSMHQSNPAVPSSPPPPGHCGAFTRPVSPGCAACPGGWAYANPRAFPKLFTCTRFPIEKETTQRILLEKQAYWLICQGQENIEEGCKGMFLILCMHFFIAYIESNFCRYNLHVFEEHPFIFIV